MKNVGCFLTYFIVFPMLLRASDLERNDEFLTSKQTPTASKEIISKKTQSFILYGLSVLFGMATTGMGYRVFYDVHNDKYDGSKTPQIVTETLATFIYAGATLFTGYQGYKKGKKKEQYQPLQSLSKTDGEAL